MNFPLDIICTDLSQSASKITYNVRALRSLEHFIKKHDLINDLFLISFPLYEEKISANFKKNSQILYTVNGCKHIDLHPKTLLTYWVLF